MARNAINSFKYFHKDIEFFEINPKEFEKFECYKSNYASGIKKYMIAYELMKNKKLDKIICLGADTITCDYLSEFLENNEDILATLDYPYQFVTKYAISPDSETQVNADVVCFNNKEAIKTIILNSIKYKDLFEQGGLNETLYSGKHNFSYKIVDYPYSDTSILYNARSKGNIIAKTNSKPWKEYTYKFYVNNNKLYTHNAKQIKVWHYCEGFFTLQEEEIEELMNLWATEFFNKETIDFFKSIGCEEYF